MTKLEKIEREIESLPPDDVWALGTWLDAFREKLWDQKLEAGSPALDALAEQALEEYNAGKAMPLVRR